MLYYKFKNYEEFKDMFGIIKHGNGVCSRKNKILLAYIRNKRLLHEAIETNNYTLLPGVRNGEMDVLSGRISNFPHRCFHCMIKPCHLISF